MTKVVVSHSGMNCSSFIATVNVQSEHIYHSLNVFNFPYFNSTVFVSSAIKLLWCQMQC